MWISDIYHSIISNQDTILSGFQIGCPVLGQSLYNMAIKFQNKGKGKGKKSTKSVDEVQFEIAQEAERRLREFLATNNDESSINLEPSTSRGACNTRNVTSRVSDDYWTNDSSSSVRNIGSTTVSDATKSIFIRKLELTINGTPIDHVPFCSSVNEQLRMTYWQI